MAADRNDELRRKITARVQELAARQTVGDPPVARQVADEFGLSYQMACYYLRGGNHRDGVDRRREYTVEELRNLELMTPGERTKYAAKTGRSPRAVYAALQRWQIRMRSYAAQPTTGDLVLEDIERAGYFDFANVAHLQACGLMLSSVSAASRALGFEYRLSLRAPNILYHAQTGRRYYMTAAEQRMLLHNPKYFLRERADAIKAGWVLSDNDPIADPPAPNKALPKRPSRTGQTAKAAKLIAQLVTIDINCSPDDPFYANIVALRGWAERATRESTKPVGE